ncbi:Non-lysosomal glucosylceramidase [Pelomyxa schiedti]|nr:Non-lysosomal glucosylceramidase [Pelomyxa schiedti]
MVVPVHERGGRGVLPRRVGWFILACSALLVSLRGVNCGTHLSVPVDQETGLYTVQIDGAVWLHGGYSALHQNGKWCSPLDDTLTLQSSSSGTGSDAIGTYSYVSLVYTTIDQSVTMITDFKTYDDIDVIVFDQSFPDGAKNTGVGNNLDLATCFPSFSDSQTGFNFLTYNGTGAFPYTGKWDEYTKFPGGVSGGCPLVIYDKSLNTIVISAMSNFMAASQTILQDFDYSLSYGIQGMVESLPPGFNHSTILIYQNGVSQAIFEWGGYLLKLTGKSRSVSGNDLTTQRLGYSTEYGAYYYSLTEPDKTYEETLVDIYDYEKDLVPIAFYQLDDWWYYTGQPSGVKLWADRPDVFPSGLDNVVDKMFLVSFALETSYFSSDNSYQSQFPFLVEETCAIPIGQDLYQQLMKNASSDWKMQLYEANDLAFPYMNMDSLQTNVSTARTWMTNMANAANVNRNTIQYGNMLPNQILQSSEFPAVTQARVNSNMAPGLSSWKIAHSSLFMWSVGLLVSKPPLWTTSDTQTNCKYVQCKEPNNVLQAITAVLSAGPLTIGDKIGSTNSTLVLRTCLNDGTLLKPDRPAIPVELMYQKTFDAPELVQLSTTLTKVGATSWTYLLAAELPWDVDILPKDLGLLGVEGRVVDLFALPPVVAVFNDTVPLHLNKMAETPPYGTAEFKMFIVSPVMSGGWTLIGDMTKFLPVAHPRISSVSTTSGSAPTMTVAVRGAVGETVTLAVLGPGSLVPMYTQCAVTGVSLKCTILCSCSPACSCGQQS